MKFKKGKKKGYKVWFSNKSALKSYNLHKKYLKEVWF
jgi:hypothetical protein